MHLGEPSKQTQHILALEPLGDQGVLVRLSSERAAQALAQMMRDMASHWLVDVVVAYDTVAVFYDLERADYPTVSQALQNVKFADQLQLGRLYLIPCCYELGWDLAAVAEWCRCSKEEVVVLHSGTVYTVYAVGFVPGFPYLGYLPERLTGVPRLDKPRRRVEPGSVGLAGRQTGIYPAAVPGGWSIVGRTPLVIADPEDEYLPLSIGDRVQFVPIDRQEFERLRGRRLGSDYSANKAST